MGREKVTISLSTKCLELIDEYAQTTGFEARSRVIEEAIFAINELLTYRQAYTQKVQPAMNPNPTQQETMNILFSLADILSKFGGILNRFQRFPVTPRTPQNTTLTLKRISADK